MASVLEHFYRPARVAAGSRTGLLGTLAFLAILVSTLWRVAATDGVFAITVDEPTHIVAGTQFLERGRATGDLTHSPLARIAVALGPYLLSRDPQLACRADRDESLTLWCGGARYWRTLTAARLGTLPFLALLLAAVWLWAGSIGGRLAGIAAALVLANVPSVLGHAGLATTDVAGAAMLMLALFAGTRWLARPSWPRALGLGAAVALALCTKLSAVLFFPVAAAGMALVLLPPRPRVALGPRRAVAQLGGTVACFVLVSWAVYDFTLDPIIGPEGLVAGGPGGLLGRVLRWKAYPLVEMLDGLRGLATLNQHGMSSYFMGEIREGGWWYFFPVMFAVKTPLALLGLFVIGAGCALRRRAARRELVAILGAMAGILSVGMASRINIGLRHLIVLYPLASIVAGCGAASLLRERSRPMIAAIPGLLLAWLVADVAHAHPDYLAYFNDAARAGAAYFSADSDLDWGQDAGRLADELRRRHIRHVNVAINGSLRFAPDIEAAELWPGQQVSGWVAASIGRVLHDRIHPPYLGLRWLECHRPAARIGQTILLYHIPAGTTPAAGTDCNRRNLAAAGD